MQEFAWIRSVGTRALRRRWILKPRVYTRLIETRDTANAHIDRDGPTEQVLEVDALGLEMGFRADAFQRALG